MGGAGAVSLGLGLTTGSPDTVPKQKCTLGGAGGWGWGL